MRKSTRIVALAICVVMLLGMLPTGVIAADPGEEVAYQLAESFEVGKSYVIVAEGKYALNNTAVNFASQDTLGSSAVTIEDGVITSDVTEGMLWTINAVSDGTTAALDGAAQYAIADQGGKPLYRLSGASGTAPLTVGGTPSKPNYATWSFAVRNAEAKEYTMYVNSFNDADYLYTLNGNEGGFNCPGVARAQWDPLTYQDAITLYEAVPVEPEAPFMEITSGNYLSTVGSNAFNCFMYDNTFSGTFGDQHMGGIELSLRGMRIATNGDLHLLPTPEQWDATPAPSRGTKTYDKETNTITVPMTFSGSPDGVLKYDLIASPVEDGMCLKMVLRSSMPEDLQGKARFNLEFLPSSYQSKTYQADLNDDGTYDNFGVFPLHAQDAMIETERPDLPGQTWYVKQWNEERGNGQPAPFATGYGFQFAAEDPDAGISITSADGDLLELYDGRNRAQNGWYVLSTLITATNINETAAEWIIKPNDTEGWVREPNVGFSQVGYSPAQEKFATVELDKWDMNYPTTMSLWRVNADGSEVMVCEKDLPADSDMTAWMRFKYARFDFTEVQEVGLYRIHYGDYVGEVFPIAKDVYDNIWQTCLTGFLTVQMDHIEVREGYKIWHGASHMDDCFLPPTGVNGWFDGMGAGTIPQSVLDKGYEADTHVDGLNKGGWFDAGDFDLQMSRNFGVLNQIIQAAEYCNNMDNHDTLSVTWNDATGGLAEMHRPDSIPDVVQQAIHGSKQQLAQYEVLGGCGGTMEVRRLRQYTHLGDPSSDTDGYIYDATLEPGEIVERDGKVYSSEDDDRYLLMSGGGGTFSTTMSGRAADFAGTAYLAAPYYREYAAQIMNAANKIWKDENLADANDFNRTVQFTLATWKLEELGIEYEDYDGTQNYAFFRARLDDTLDAAIEAGVNANLPLLALIPLLGEEYKAKLVPSVEATAAALTVNTQPYGVNFTSGSGWGASPNTYSGVRNISFMYYNFPNVVGAEKMEQNILRSVDYLMGRHPATNASWISGVGTKSALHPYNSNRAEESFIPGSILPGHITFNDYVESMDDFSFLWFEGESIINYQSSWLPVGIAAGKIANKEAEPEVADTVDFESNLDLQLKTIETTSAWGGGTSTDGYFTDKGFDVFMYSTQFDRGFGDQHCAGIELLQNGRRVATNGDIHLLPTPEQWDATPAPTRDNRTFTEDMITVDMTLPAETFEDETPENPAVKYHLVAEPEEGGVKLTVKLDEPLPADLIGKAGFNLEFLPAVYMEKSFMADADGDGTYDSFGVFPRTPDDEMEQKDRARTNNQAWYVKEWNEDRGDAQPLPFATGNKMTFAAEDDDYRIRIESEDGLALYDGRNRAQNGWYVLRTLIPADATEIVWHISPDTDASWTREPNISHSQVGYEPKLSKKAVIELDPNYVGSDEATLKRLNADGTYTDVFTGPLGEAKSWKRYTYRDFDFSSIEEPGTYAITYDGVTTDTFPIKKHAYEKIWQQSLSNYLAVQMDHIKVREAYKIWHNASHMDDGLQAPINTSWFDYPGSGIKTAKFEEYTHVDGLNVGGWYDAGDFDIQVARNIGVIQDLALAYQVFGVEYDTLDCDWVTNFVELHRQDGDNDVQQQIKHGVLQLVGQLENVGMIYSCLEVPTLRQYTHLGDGSKDTDNRIYDPTLKEDEVDGLRSGKKDDRLFFATATKNSRTQLSAAACLAAAGTALVGCDDELAEKCLNFAKAIWVEEEASHTGTSTSDWALALELLYATGEETYKARVEALFESQIAAASFGRNGWKAVRVLDKLDASYTESFKTALAAYAGTYVNANNPYGVADSNSMWGNSTNVVSAGQIVAVLHKYFPEIISADYVFDVVNYILGMHPYNSTSWLSGVGTKSVELAYGSNRAENYYIAGGIVPGYVTIAPDLPEHMDDFGFLWFENEYVIDTAAKWVLLGYAAEEFARETDEACEHDYATKVTAPTCLRGGYTTYICNKCFESYVADETEALGHDWDDGYIRKAAMATFDGIYTYTCNRCGLTRDEVIPAPGTVDMSDIDFTEAASADRIIIDNPVSTVVNEGTGLFLTSSSGSNEDNAAKDLVKIPTKGDWSASMKIDFTGLPAGTSRWRLVENFAILAMDDYNNCVGLRAQDTNVFQNYQRINGTTTAATVPGGLGESDVHYFKIDKVGTSYTYSWSTDGETYTELFTLADTGIEARCIALDSYTTGFAWGGSAAIPYTYNVAYVDYVLPEAPAGINIDFTNPADASKFDILGQSTAAIAEGEGLALVTTKQGFEPANGQLTGDAATAPLDAVKVPVSGDWAATLKFDFSQNGARNGWYQFFGFYAGAGDDYHNLAGIRGGDGAMQDFLRVDGTITADSDLKSAPGLAADGTYWYRITKEGTTYTCARSADGEEFTDMFSFTDTGIEADALYIDAYTGMTEGYKFTLKSLNIPGGGEAPEPPEDPETPIDDPTIPIYENPQYTFAERAADLVARMSAAQKGNQVVSVAAAIPAEQLGGGALNVPGTKNVNAYHWWSECLHGYSANIGGSGGYSNATSYPQNTSIGNTWNPELYYQEATMISDEIRERAAKNSQTGNCIDLNFYSPTVNMHRDPRWGRNEESYSEDVLLNSVMASAFVCGVEGKNMEGNLLDPDGYKKAMCTVKHYVANNSERNRLSGGASTSLRALREYYTAPYREVIQNAGVTSVMTAYSTLNGEPCSYSSYLMETLLRQTFGLDGHITSDCDSTATQNRHAYVNPYTGETMTDIEALAGALAHGEDLECTGGYSGFGTYGSKMSRMLEAAPETDKGIFTENSLDVSVHRLMEARIATGEFDDNLAYTQAAAERVAAQAETGREIPNQTVERLAMNDEVTKEAVVMLQNKGVLPLQIPETGSDYSVVIVGAWQTDMYKGLYTSGASNATNEVNIQRGITEAIQRVNPDVQLTYIVSNNPTVEDEATIAAADAVIVTTGTNSSYSKEDGDRTSIILPNNQEELISKVGKLNDNTIAIMETCGPMRVTEFQNDVNAILWSSFGGIRKGTGFGCVITGEVNPSGKLTDTWYQNVNDVGESDIPSILDYDLYPSEGKNGRTYMYYNGENTPSYPFGYGLSYTTYEYSNLQVDKTDCDANDTVTVSFDVKNTGTVAGKEVTQLYVAQPDAPAELQRPIRRLMGFEKIELQPDETKTVTMEVAIPDLAFFDETDKRYEVDTGAYQIQVGKDSASANLTADFDVTGELDVYPVLLTVKANQVGDTEAGIEERIIFDKGATVNPQLTVAMNDESLCGYVIAHQSSPIDQVESSPLPEGMTFEYHSNRPSVAKVTRDGIKAVNAGVATITVTGELDGHVVSADFVVYVEANSFIDGITLDGEPLEGFNREKFAYEINAADYETAPVVGYVANTEGLEVTVDQFDSSSGVAVITSVETASGTTSVYRIGMGNAPVSTDFREGWEAAQGKGWTVVNGNENATFGENGLTIIGEDGMGSNFYSEPAFGEWAAQTKVTLAEALATNGQRTGMVVKDTDGSYVLLVYEIVVSTGWWARTNYYVTAYAMQNGTLNQIARTGNLGALTEVGLRVIKSGENYSFAYGLADVWTDMNGSVKLGMADPKLGLFCGEVAGATATFDGIDVCKVSQLYPRAASVKLNGAALADFDPETFVYNFEVTGDTVPVFEAVSADPEVQIDIEQMDAATGMAKITAFNEITKTEYFFYFNYAPSSDYFADGAYNEAQWSIERENKETYQVVKGQGIVLPTQTGDIHGTGGAWENCFNAPAQGNWQAVAKIVYPNVPTANYQQAMFLVWQDENNYLRMNAQTSNLNMEPGVETNGSFNGNLGSGQAIPAEDGTVTLYFMIEKEGTSYTVGYSQDGINFTRLNTVKNVNFANPKIGLFATQNSSSAQMNMYYEYVALTWINGVQQMTYNEMATWAAQNVADYVAADVPEEATEAISFSALPHGYTMEVTSSDPAVIAADGTVTPAATDKDVTLTIKISDDNTSATATAKVKVAHVAHEHNYVSVVTAPTCTEDGYTTYTCECGESYVADVVAALGHNFVGDVCTRCGMTRNEAILAATEAAQAKAEAAEQAAKDAEDAAAEAASSSALDKTAAEAAKTAAEAARKAAETAKTAAEAAKAAAEKSDAAAAAKAAQAAADAADAAQAKADAALAQAAAQRAQTAAEAAKDAAEQAAEDAADDMSAAQAAKAAAEAAKTAAEAAKTAAAAANTAAAKEAADAATKAAQAATAQAAAQAAQKAAETAQKAAETAAASSATNKTAAEAAKTAAEAAKAAAEAAKTAAEAADADAADEAAKAAAEAANAAKAQAAAQSAQGKAEEAQEAAEAAKAEAAAAAAKGDVAAEEAAAAKAAAEKAEEAAEAAKAAAALSAKAADASNTAAAEAAAKAADDAAKVADALKEVAAAKVAIAEAQEKAAQAVADAEAAKEAAKLEAEAAEKAKEAAKQAELGAAKYYALTQLAIAADSVNTSEYTDDQKASVKELVDEGIAAIGAGADAAAITSALDAAIKALSVVPEDNCPSKNFTDVPRRDYWAHEGIDFCVSKGYMNGMTDTLFAPNGVTTRAQLVTILYRIAGEPKVEFSGVFSDVKEGKWYSNAVEWAAAQGFVKGYADKTFLPNEKITREQMATILYRYSGSPKVEGDLKVYQDHSYVSAYAVDAMIWATSEELINGVSTYGSITLDPRGNATRAQIATIIARYLAE